MKPLVDLRELPVTVDEAIRHVSHDGAGGLAIFVGVVRSHNDGRDVVKLEYEAYAPMARLEMGRIADEIAAEVPGVRLAALHRIGSLLVGDAAIVCAASAPHRGEAFRACRLLIDRIKERVPIWKREHGPEGAYWVGWVDARCAAEHGLDTDGAHDGHAHGAQATKKHG